MIKKLAIVLLGNLALSGCLLDNTPVHGEEPETKIDSPDRFRDRSDEEDHAPGGLGRR